MSNPKRFSAGDLNTANLTRRVPRSGEYVRASSEQRALVAHASWHSLGRFIDTDDDDGVGLPLELDRRVLGTPPKPLVRQAGPYQGALETTDEASVRTTGYLLAIGILTLAVALAWTLATGLHWTGA